MYRLVKEDHRLRIWHIPLGPMLWKENPTLYWPGDPSQVLTVDYYATEYKDEDHSSSSSLNEKEPIKNTQAPVDTKQDSLDEPKEDSGIPSTQHNFAGADGSAKDKKRAKDLAAVDKLPWAHPKRIWATTKLVASYGITRDVISHQSRGLEHVHARAPKFDNKVEYLWTTAQVCSAMIMSIAHGANDISNAIGPVSVQHLL